MHPPRATITWDCDAVPKEWPSSSELQMTSQGWSTRRVASIPGNRPVSSIRFAAEVLPWTSLWTDATLKRYVIYVFILFIFFVKIIIKKKLIVSFINKTSHLSMLEKSAVLTLSVGKKFNFLLNYIFLK